MAAAAEGQRGIWLELISNKIAKKFLQYLLNIG
jgi:hypothetical protein